MELPTGTVTFLFTDIEGSTRIWEHQPATMQAALPRHDAVLASAIEQHGGLIIKSMGDGLFAVFASAYDAVLATLAGQRALVAEKWDEAIGQLRVRMALHSGTAEVREADYFGINVNHASRLLSAGHGGQILVSAATYNLIQHDLPADTDLVDLGEHRLRDLLHPEHIFQLVARDLPVDFPALRTVDALRTKLPIQPTSFVGREQELKAVGELLQRDQVRLVTLIGPGGMGKTRLAVQVAADRSADFEDGAYFVDLAPVTDPEVVGPTIVSALGIRGAGSQPAVETLQQFLRDKSILLLLDNFERLLEASGLVSELVQATQKAKFLVTSREALNLHVEWLFPLGGMPYPQYPPGHRLRAEEASTHAVAYSAIQLFVERARRVRPDFSLEDEFEGVMRVCQLVEGMPLAIELAAAWTRTLDSAAVAAEIQRNLNFLATRLRDVPARHRSIVAVFEQTWKMLDQEERTVFPRLAVFRGGFDRTAAEEVADASLPVLTALVDKSLLRWEADGRYYVHELLRQHAEERLARSAEDLAHAKTQHCRYFARFLSSRLTEMMGGRQHETTEEIQIELENIRAAWNYALERARVNELQKLAETLSVFFQYQSRYLEGANAFASATRLLSDMELSGKDELALASILTQHGWFDIRLGRLKEAEDVLRRSLAIYRQYDAAPGPGLGTDPLTALGILASIRGEYATMAEYGEQARQASEARNDRYNQELSYYLLARASLLQGEFESAKEFAQRAFTVSKGLGDEWFMAYCLNEMGNAALALGHYEEARGHYESSYQLRESFADTEGMALALMLQGTAALRLDDYAEAMRLYDESYSLYQEINDSGGLSSALNGLGAAATGLEQFEEARRHFRQALQVATDIEFIPLMLSIVTGIGEFLIRLGDDEKGLALLSLSLHHPSSQFETKEQARRLVNQYEANLFPSQFAEAMAAGQHSDLNEVTIEVLNRLAKPLGQPGD